MTNKEALQAYINFPLRDASVELALLNAGVEPTGDYNPETSREGVETALAGLIFILLTSPKSVSELDYQLTAPEVAGLQALRQELLDKWGLPGASQAYTGPEIHDASHLW